VRHAGGTRSANVGMSNVNEIKTLIAEYLRFPVQRQSWQGESVLRRNPIGEADGYQVNIPELCMIVITMWGRIVTTGTLQWIASCVSKAVA